MILLSGFLLPCIYNIKTLAFVTPGCSNGFFFEQDSVADAESGVALNQKQALFS